MSSKKISNTIRWYNENAQKFATLIEDLAIPRYINDFANQLSKDSQVLDAGCGPGRDTFFLEKKGLKLTGLDLSTELLKIASLRCPNATFIEGNLLKLPFGDESFDGIWANACLLHLRSNRDVSKALKEFHRVLKNDGILHVFVRANNGGKKVLFYEKRLFHNFSLTEISSLITQSGFKMIIAKQEKEIDQHIKGRPNVEWIQCLSRKI